MSDVPGSSSGGVYEDLAFEPLASHELFEDAFREDLAYIHDIGFGDLAKNAAPVLLDALRGSGIDRGLVVDLCCGSGLLTQDLSAAGYRVVGIDISQALL